MNNPRSFASDNNAGIHPEILQAIVDANVGHCVGYGDDPYTEKAVAKFKKVFSNDADVFFTFNGTGANVVALQAMCQPFHAVICAKTAHINADECGAPEKFAQCKLLDVETPDGKLTPELIKEQLVGIGFEHHVQPKVISIAQVSELGTVYTVDELKALRALADEHDLLIHMDGARLANAAAYLGVSLCEAATGVDILSFGGTKNGLMLGEAVIILNQNLKKDFKYIRKQSAQLNSKMRFIAAQFSALFNNDLWLRNAKHANDMAKLLADKIADIPQVKIVYPVQSNAVFVSLPKQAIARLQQTYFFYLWDEEENVARWMCSFDTTKEDIERFVERIA